MSCLFSSGCTFDDIYQYRLSLGSWNIRYQQIYNSTITTYQFMCSHIDGTVQFELIMSQSFVFSYVPELFLLYDRIQLCNIYFVTILVIILFSLYSNSY